MTLFKKRRLKPLPPDVDVRCRKGKRTTKIGDRTFEVRDGKILWESSCWYTRIDERDVKLFTDRGASEARVRELVKRAENVAVGLVEPAVEGELIDDSKAIFFEDMDAGRLRRKRRRRTVSAQYRRQVEKHLGRLFKACSIEKVADIRLAPVQNFVDELAEDHDDEYGNPVTGLAPRTCNSYGETARLFTSWCVRTRRLSVDPLVALEELDEDADIRKQRRALAPEEAVALLKAAEERPVAQAKFFVKANGRVLTDKDRRRIGLRHALTWKALLLLGVRRRALRGLTWGDIHLDDAYVFVPKELDKAKTDRHVAMRPDLVADLRRWRILRGNPSDDELAFDCPANLVRILKKDLRHAGIEFATGDGDVDVHALRTTCGTWLERVSSRGVAGKHLGHAGHRVTEGRYVKHQLRDTRAALDELPELPIPSLEAAREGTAGESVA